MLESAAKHSVTVAGHPTSIRIEPIFWEQLLEEAASRNLPVNALLASIDVERLLATPAPNLASAVRQWLFVNALKRNGKEVEPAG